jgi:hypothetical protein
VVKEKRTLSEATFANCSKSFGLTYPKYEGNPVLLYNIAIESITSSGAACREAGAFRLGHRDFKLCLVHIARDVLLLEDVIQRQDDAMTPRATRATRNLKRIESASILAYVQ